MHNLNVTKILNVFAGTAATAALATHNMPPPPTGTAVNNLPKTQITVTTSKPLAPQTTGCLKQTNSVALGGTAQNSDPSSLPTGSSNASQLPTTNNNTGKQWGITIAHLLRSLQSSHFSTSPHNMIVTSCFHRDL